MSTGGKRSAGVIISMHLAPRERTPSLNCSVAPPKPPRASSTQSLPWPGPGSINSSAHRKGGARPAKFNSSGGLNFVCVSVGTAVTSSFGKLCPKLSWMLLSVFYLYRHTHMHISVDTWENPSHLEGQHHTAPTSWGGFC